MARSLGLRATDMTICDSRTPQKTCSIRFECAHPPQSFHSFDTPRRDPLTITIYKTPTAGSVLIIVFRIHTSSAVFSLRTLYLSRYSRSDKRTTEEIHEVSQGEGMKRKSLKRTASVPARPCRTRSPPQIPRRSTSELEVPTVPTGKYASALTARARPLPVGSPATGH